MAVALVFLLYALITPLGLATSYGSSAISSVHHGEWWNSDDGHARMARADIQLGSMAITRWSGVPPAILPPGFKRVRVALTSRNSAHSLTEF